MMRKAIQQPPTGSRRLQKMEVLQAVPGRLAQVIESVLLGDVVLLVLDECADRTAGGFRHD